MQTSVTNGTSAMNYKSIKISEKRQITIPKSIYTELGFSDRAQCTIKDGALVITPVHSSDGEFASEILADLIHAGYEGEELLRKFKEMQGKVRPAVNKMLKEAHMLAESTEKDDFNEIFEQED